MGFKKQTPTKQTDNKTYKHIMLLCGYEFRGMTKDQACEYLTKNKIHFDKNSNIYQDGDNVMYQLAAKIYENEIQTIETKLAEGVYLITHLYRFLHTENNKKLF
jgi:uncharacterized Zn ribbon protein